MTGATEAELGVGAPGQLTQSPPYILYIGGQPIRAKPGFCVRAIEVDNYSNQYVLIENVQRFVPPNQTGYLIPLPDAMQVNVSFQAPPGIQQAVAIQGQQVLFVLYDQLEGGRPFPGLPPPTLDVNAADIQPIASVGQAGLSGLAADAGHVHPYFLAEVPAHMFWNVATRQLGIGTNAPNLFGYAGDVRAVSLLTPLGSIGSILELATSAADGQNNAGAVSFLQTANILGDQRIAHIAGSAAGVTVQNRGGLLRLFTKADGGALLERARFDNLGAFVMPTTPGTTGTFEVRAQQLTPTAVRHLFGTDGTGWRWALASNQGGVVTDRIAMFDSGRFLYQQQLSLIAGNGDPDTAIVNNGILSWVGTISPPGFAASQWTVPVAGLYWVTGLLDARGDTVGSFVRVSVAENGVIFTHGHGTVVPNQVANQQVTSTLSVLLLLNAGDVIDLRSEIGAGNWTRVGGQGQFCAQYAGRTPAAAV